MMRVYVIDTVTARAQIVAALDTVTALVDDLPVQVTGHATRPDMVNAYDAWPEFRWAVPVTACMAETNWHVLMALPGADLVSAVQSGDVLMSAMASALFELGRVERVEPVLIPMTDQPNAGLPGLRCELTI